MNDLYVGFYWTFPVDWADHDSLSEDVETAAAESQTIRYQMELARAWVDDHDGKLVREIAFMDVDPHRATDLVLKSLREARRVCDEYEAPLVYVDFTKLHYWRHNKHIRDDLSAWGIDRAIPLWPREIEIDGKKFHPGNHFARWRDLDFEARVRCKRAADEGLEKALSEIPDGYGRWPKIADWLNERKIRSYNGRAWTGDNVRKAVKHP